MPIFCACAKQFNSAETTFGDLPSHKLNIELGNQGHAWGYEARQDIIYMHGIKVGSGLNYVH
jgi:hypothetical protein